VAPKLNVANTTPSKRVFIASSLPAT
jgi:hypothetical protein